MNRGYARKSDSLLVGIIAGLLMTASTACATDPKKGTMERPDSDFGVNSDFEIKSGRGTLVDPTVLVVFELVGTELCPVDTQFKVDGTPLATGVPTLTRSESDPRPATKMKWKAVDTSLNPVPILSDWNYALVFHPFVGAGAGRFISKTVDETQVDGSIIKVQQVGPFDLRFEEQIPVGVDYKYSVVRVKDIDPRPNKQKWIIVDACKPLDPLIRVY